MKMQVEEEIDLQHAPSTIALELTGNGSSGLSG
jgi:hypothetical protein